MLLLYPTRLLALNAISHAPVQDIVLAGRGAPGYAGQPLALATDPATAGIYLSTSAIVDPGPLTDPLSPKTFSDSTALPTCTSR